jgi:uncharacterized protein
MSVFADTSGFYAVFAADDANHSRAKAAWADWMRGGEVLVTNSYVVLETMALLQNRIGLPAVRAMHEDVVPLLRIEWVSEEQHRAAVAAVLAAARPKLSVVDCVSFQTMRQHGLRVVFSFDSHFKEQGFEMRPHRVN